MIVNYFKMSGEELKRIYDISGINAVDFAVRIGLKSRGQLYTMFSKKAVPEEIEKAIIADPDIAKNRQLLKVDNQVSEQKEVGFTPGYDLWAKTIEMLQETLVLIREDNKFIKEDAKIYRSIVEEGVKKGAISFGPVKKTA